MPYLFDVGLRGAGFGIPFWVAPIVGVAVLWSLFWKGLALWHSSKREDVWWFIAFLIVNTLGILEIIYLFVVAKKTFANLFTSGKTK